MHQINQPDGILLWFYAYHGNSKSEKSACTDVYYNPLSDKAKRALLFDANRKLECIYNPGLIVLLVHVIERTYNYGVVIW